MALGKRNNIKWGAGRGKLYFLNLFIYIFTFIYLFIYQEKLFFSKINLFWIALDLTAGQMRKQESSFELNVPNDP